MTTMTDDPEELILTLKEASELLITIEQALREYDNLVGLIGTEAGHIFRRISEPNRHLTGIHADLPDHPDHDPLQTLCTLTCHLIRSRNIYTAPTPQTQSLQHEMVEAVVKALAWCKQPQVLQAELDDVHQMINWMFTTSNLRTDKLTSGPGKSIGSNFKGYLSGLFRRPEPTQVVAEEPEDTRTFEEKLAELRNPSIETIANDRVLDGSLFHLAGSNPSYYASVKRHGKSVYVVAQLDAVEIKAIERIRAVSSPKDLLEDTEVYEMRALLGELKALFERVCEGNGGKTCFMTVLPNDAEPTIES